jgi:malonyl-CoA O-methyltransferase
MATERPPTIDPTSASPWLHEEVGRRMADRLEWIVRSPQRWVDWEPVQGGLQAHALVAGRYPKAQVTVVETNPRHALAAAKALAGPWWQRLAGRAQAIAATPPPGAQMLWANMALHRTADPQALLALWHAALAVDGFLMFSCLGPDTLQELRAVYAALGWPPAAQAFTDMHDWGDMLVHGGFAEPVMDMERITLTFESPQRLLQELRGLGGNLHPERFAACRGRAWRDALHRELAARLAGADGRLALTFEIIYGHALKPVPRARVAEQSAVSLGDMRAMLSDKRARE